VKKFAFRLRRLLDIRTQQKRALAAAMARLQGQIMEIDRAIKAADDEWRSRRERHLQEMSATAQDRLETVTYMQSLEDQAGGLRGEKNKLIQNLETTRRSFEAAARGERTLENLRARKLEEYALEVNRAEQGVADELAMQKDWQKSDRAATDATETAGKDA
jgi:flagellar export protein FliJ